MGEHSCHSITLLACWSAGFQRTYNSDMQYAPRYATAGRPGRNLLVDISVVQPRDRQCLPHFYSFLSLNMADVIVHPIRRSLSQGHLYAVL
jgi:hypothetical protein